MRLMRLRKRIFFILVAMVFCLGLTACSDENNSTAESSAVNNSTSSIDDKNSESTENNNDKAKQKQRQIRVTAENGDVIVFALNDSRAADDLYGQLPLDIDIEDYSNNEKIFYPAPLATDNTPRAKNQIGTLAYYEPWGDVVMFFGEFHENNSLYELGRVATGRELIKNLSGKVKIEKVE